MYIVMMADNEACDIHALAIVPDLISARKVMAANLLAALGRYAPKKWTLNNLSWLKDRLAFVTINSWLTVSFGKNSATYSNEFDGVTFWYIQDLSLSKDFLRDASEMYERIQAKEIVEDRMVSRGYNPQEHEDIVKTATDAYLNAKTNGCDETVAVGEIELIVAEMA